MNGAGTVVDANLVTWMLLTIVALSLVQGARKGAKGSVKQLALFLAGAVLTVSAVILAAFAATAASPYVQSWASERILDRPSPDASFFAQFGYTALAGLRDMPLFRFAALFLIIHALIRVLVGFVTRALADSLPLPAVSRSPGGAISRTFGGMIGTALGTVRALLATAVLFAYCALFPQGPMSEYIQQSGLYREVAAQIIRPATGSLLEERLPVFAKAMSVELDQLWQKRYDVIDAELPDDIVLAAKSVAEEKNSDEEKARALYDWVGTRIAYDHDKVRAYEEQGDWREQNPAMTFATRKGVCIDYARLYASMARAVGLEVRVVTGLGYDGRGGYGAHAWNEVYLAEQQRWVPLDATWANTGDWFDPPGFADTHIRQEGVSA
ncbi:transglutaminase domain-containing protein [Cohnella boryungensis]|uniref:Transglutaminase domain-containing protein n=1 Tax=Cohnella boryungensis TaxID=768479 RepID=A0ABV8S8Z9_9BACL